MYTAIVESIIVLILGNLYARRLIRGEIVLATFSGIFLMTNWILWMVIPPVLWQMALLFVTATITRAFKTRFWIYTIVSVVLTLLAYWPQVERVRTLDKQYDKLRIVYPLESMDDKIPFIEPRNGSDKLPNIAKQRMDQLEIEMDRVATHADTRAVALRNHRNTLLKRLHENNVETFINTPGFGVGRRIVPASPSERNLQPDPEWANTNVPQPGMRSGSAGVPDVTILPESHQNYYDLHNEGLVDFLNPNRYGYVKDRQHVAGFLSHRFSKVPEPLVEWKIHRLDLVSLLLHSEPQVYVSDYLPRMDELKKSAVRQLDPFEIAALKKLREGEDLVTGTHTGGMRMLGSIRTTQQCIQCHGGKRGDLLGAFTYELREKK